MSFSFGSNLAGSGTTTTPSTGFSFGGAPNVTSTTGTTLATGTNTGFTFGTNVASNTTTPSAGLNFGPAATTASATSTAINSGFGANTGLGGFGINKGTLGTGFTANTNATTALSTTSTTTTSGFGGLGGAGVAAVAGQAGPVSSSGLGGTPASTAQAAVPAGFGFGGPATAAPVATSSSCAASSSMDSKPLKDQLVSPEMLQLVESFKNWVKEERSVATEISHTSDRQHTKVSESVEVLSKNLKSLSSEMAAIKHNLDRLKVDVSEELQNAELAQRTRDMAPTLQFESTAPQEYFVRLLCSFQAKMTAFARQIDDIEMALEQSKNGHGDVNNESLIRALQKQQATLTNMAGRLQILHEHVQKEASKEENLQHWNKNKSLNGNNADFTSPFKSKSSVESKGSFISRVGPSPFIGVDNSLNVARASLLASGQQYGGNSNALLNSPSIGQPSSGFGNANNNSSLFGVSSINNSSSFFGQNTMGKRSKV